MEENTCRFPATKSISESINIICFVYEKQAEFARSFILPASYTLNTVTKGSGILHTSFGDAELREGDLFFTFPAKRYYIENTGGLNFMYINFVGSRVPGLFERAGISAGEPVYHGFDFVAKRWFEDTQRASVESFDLVCEELILYTLSFLCRLADERKGSGGENAILSVKQYIDTHYSDSTVSLESLGRVFNYSPKYLSSAFAKLTKVSYSEYLAGLRMEHAKRLMKSGVRDIKEIAFSCGYTDSLYFSKCFRRNSGLSPRSYIRLLCADDGAAFQH